MFIANSAGPEEYYASHEMIFSIKLHIHWFYQQWIALSLSSDAIQKLVDHLLLL